MTYRFKVRDGLNDFNDFNIKIHLCKFILKGLIYIGVYLMNIEYQNEIQFKIIAYGFFIVFNLILAFLYTRVISSAFQFYKTNLTNSLTFFINILFLTIIKSLFFDLKFKLEKKIFTVLEKNNNHFDFCVSNSQ